MLISFADSLLFARLTESVLQGRRELHRRTYTVVSRDYRKSIYNSLETDDHLTAFEIKPAERTESGGLKVVEATPPRLFRLPLGGSPVM